MTIKEGYNGKPLTIRIHGRKYGSAEFWIIQEGLPESCERYKETLSYCSVVELLALRKEIDNALMSITGLNESD
jgi:hypothetical protein